MDLKIAVSMKSLIAAVMLLQRDLITADKASTTTAMMTTLGNCKKWLYFQALSWQP